MSLRRALPSDAAALGHVVVEGWRAAYTGLMPEAILAAHRVEDRAANFQQRLEAGGAERCFLVESDGEVVGFVWIGPSRDEDAGEAGEIYALYLLPSCWGRGLGRALFQRACEELAASGHRAVTLWVLDDNARGRRFYEAAGMRADGATKIEVDRGFELPHLRYALPL